MGAIFGFTNSLTRGIIADPPYGVGKDYGDASKDDLVTFQWAVELVADSGLPASVHMSVSRLYDLPRRPQWTGVWNKPLGMSGLIAYPVYPHWEPIAFYNIKGDVLPGINGKAPIVDVRTSLPCWDPWPRRQRWTPMAKDWRLSCGTHTVLSQRLDHRPILRIPVQRW